MKKLLALGALALSFVSIVAPSGSSRSADCLVVRAVFYTSSDWQRLAQGLAANASSCAQYYVTIPALGADKTQMRPGAASYVRSLGPSFHALAEVNYSAWQDWVSSTGNSWYGAGLEIRRRMAASGFDVASGDSWAVNELSSAVRAGSGSARQNVRDLVRGLYEGDGSVLQAKGVVFVVSVGQTGVSFPAYKATWQSWLQDNNFWVEMSSYVSDFFQEVYGDVRTYAVLGATPSTRMALLNQYLQYPYQLATAPNAPPSEQTARAFLSASYGPLANASWAWGSSYGWTEIGSDVMADYVSAQTYAMRVASSTGRLGFAWNPLNTLGLSASDYTIQVNALLARLAGSIHESDGGDPTLACEATGCSSVVDGATAATGWNTFATWAPTVAAFNSPAITATAGTAAGPLTVQLTAGTAVTKLPIPSTVTVTSTSRTMTFSTSASGPWTPSLTLSLDPGMGNAAFYTLDPTPGSPTLTTNLNGEVSTQAETVAAPALAQTTTTTQPEPAQVTGVTYSPVKGHMHVAARLVDGSGRPVQGIVGLSLVVGTSPVVSTLAATGADGAFGLTAEPLLQRGCYLLEIRSITAPGHVWNGQSQSQTDCVNALPAHIAATALVVVEGRLHAEVAVADGAGRPVRARVSYSILRGSTTFASTSGPANSEGRLGLTAGTPLEVGCYSLGISSISEAGFAWDHAAPVQRLCVTTLPVHVASVAFGRRHGHLHVSVSVAGETGGAVVAHLSIAVLRDTTLVASSQGTTDAAGRYALTAGPPVKPGCYAVGSRRYAPPASAGTASHPRRPTARDANFASESMCGRAPSGGDQPPMIWAAPTSKRLAEPRHASHPAAVCHRRLARRTARSAAIPIRNAGTSQLRPR